LDCFFFVAVLSVWPAAPARADTAKKHLTLDEIIVTEDAATEPMGTAVGVKKIEKGKNINIPDVLKNEPDIDMQRRTSIGDTGDRLAIRGFSGSRIMLNIDGRPVNATGLVGGYYIDWGTIPLDNIEKIEIIRGGSSVRYGNNALGGVVNVITKKPTETPTVSLFGTYGGGDGIDSFQNYRLTHTYKVGALGYSLAGSYQKADPFLWNNDFEGKNLAAAINLDMPLAGELTLGMQYANAQRGFIRTNRVSSDPDSPDFNRKINSAFPLAFGETFSPYSGTAFIPGPGAEWDKTKYYLDLGYTQPIGDSMLKFKLYQNHEDRKEKNYSSSDINGAYPDGQLVFDRDVASDRSYGGSLEMTKPLGDHELLVGAEHKVLGYGDTTTNFVDLTYNNAPWVTSRDDLSYKSSSEGVSWGYYLQDTWQVSERWMLSGGLRYDQYENRSIHGSTTPGLEDEALTPKLTGTYRPNDSDTVTASIYQALRTPGLDETYWWAEGATNGDPVLKPEKNNAAELVYQHGFGDSAFMRLSAYYYRVDDYIMFRFDPTWYGAYNIDQAELYGASLDGKADLTDWLRGNLCVTFQHSRKEGDIYDSAGLSDEIDYLPDWKVAAGLEFKLPYQSVFDITLRYVGERQAIYAYSSGWPAQQYFKLMELDPYITVDVDLKFPLGRHAEISGYVENLLDEEYEEQFGYPMPGIVFGAALKLYL
jgi:outer membrane receptor protein involved in Fe transport